MPFTHRSQAGRLLALRLRATRERDPVIVALPRGGVPVAGEIARALQAPLEVLVVRKLGVPGAPEYAMGAVTEGGFFWLNRAILREQGVTREQLEETLTREKAEVARRARVYRQGLPMRELRGRSVILVDDGLATGATAFVAVQFLRRLGVKSVTLAVPVSSPQSAAILASRVDRFVCLQTPPGFVSVGQWYDDFSPVDDAEVLAGLRRAREFFEEDRLKVG